MLRASLGQRRPSAALGLAFVVALGGVAMARPAVACGGFFCDGPGGPNGPVPIAQTAENVLFSVDEDPATGTSHLEAHIQIFYSGPADKFSWVVPVDSAPKLSIGSNAIFQILEPATRPRISLTQQVEGTCKVRRSLFDFGDDEASFAPTRGGNEGGGRDDDPTVKVAFRGEVGPFDAAVIHSDSADELITWLTTNQYFVSPDAATLIASYVAERKYFVALKLLSGKDVGEIEPIVLKFDGPGPCVPIKLTAIAALNDLRINLWVLAKARAVPQNFYEMQLNLARLSWLDGGQNYEDLMRQAANEAGGHAFRAEYVGTPVQVATQLETSIASFNLEKSTLARSPAEAFRLVSSLPQSTQMTTLLRKHFPMPETLRQQGVSEDQFYANLATFVGNTSFPSFDAAAFAKDVDQNVVEPIRAAAALFRRHPKLTRLATFLSPDEMTKDPTFLFNSSLPDVSNVLAATLRVMCGDEDWERCEAPVRLDVAGGPSVWYRQSGCAPDATSAQLGDTPALEVAFQRLELGEGEAKVDNRAAITQRVRSQSVPSPDCSCRVGGVSRGPGAGAGLLVLVVGAVLGRHRRRRRD